MPNLKEERHDDVPRPSRGNTVTAQGENQAPKAQEPFERDESAQSQSADASNIRRMGEIAHAAAESDQQDTTKAQELDATYHRVRQTAEPAPKDKVNRNQRSG